jgi:hypothetical protein
MNIVQPGPGTGHIKMVIENDIDRVQILIPASTEMSLFECMNDPHATEQIIKWVKSFLAIESMYHKKDQ